MKRRSLIRLALLPWLPWLPAMAAPAKPVINVSTLVGDDPATDIAELVLREAYSRLGYQLEVHRLPGERTLIYANEGRMDGELYRKLGMDRTYGNLVIVPVALLTYEIVVFTHGTSFVLHGWDSLKPYTIGHVRGIKIVQENTIGMKTEAVPTMTQAFQKMMVGRTDVVVGNRLSGMAVIKQLKLDEVVVMTPPLAAFPVYHYLHKKHEALVPQLAAVLRQMRTDKVIESIQQHVAAGS
ncbi:ABC transporter substrate-binding protein [Duganella sp. BJB475]|nr:ABC transporter substrate-binding protein [Duganella sp. BJB475]RFP34920.1 ABC transporter substrate-binding protein [Duganella sp. BJB476]